MKTRFLYWLTLGTAMAVVNVPAVAEAKPHRLGNSGVAAAMFTDMGGFVCLATALLGIAALASAAIRRRKNWRTGSIVCGLLNIGVAIVFARLAKGYGTETRIAFGVGVAGLVVPGLYSMLSAFRSIADSTDDNGAGADLRTPLDIS